MLKLFQTGKKPSGLACRIFLKENSLSRKNLASLRFKLCKKNQRSTFSVFTSFFYYDFKKDDVKAGEYFEDDVEHDKKVYLEENLFRLYAKANILEYPISVTDDGHYMCPGYVSRVGCFDVPYAENLIIVFSELLKNFVKLIEKSDDLKIIKTIAKQICL